MAQNYPVRDAACSAGPLRTLFMLTSMPIGGAETLLVNLVRRMDRSRITPEIACLKSAGELGEVLANEMPVHSGIIKHKLDVAVLFRLQKLICERKIDAVVTVGCGDKMFWGRLAAWRANVPVILSALHSTGWPDGVGRLNRLLTPITDAFIGVARAHGEYLVERERFPAEKVHVISNGVDCDRFQPSPQERASARRELGIAENMPLVGIVAALRPEKNHELFLRAAALVQRRLPEVRFVVVGDGPERGRCEQWARELGIGECVYFLGSRSDVPRWLSALDLFALTSHNEANPVSILEAMACGIPVVAPRVGSIAESVAEEKTGYLVEPGDEFQQASRWLNLLQDPTLARQMGIAGRRAVMNSWSLDRMVRGYEALIERTYTKKRGPLRMACINSDAKANGTSARDIPSQVVASP
jgi:glycosyltransferase involved in cell wall biosynthesis